METDITVTRHDDNVDILVETARAESLYKFLRAHGFAPTFPQDAICSATGLRRLSDGRVVRQYQVVVRELALIDHKKTAEDVVEEWLKTQT